MRWRLAATALGTVLAFACEASRSTPDGSPSPVIASTPPPADAPKSEGGADTFPVASTDARSLPESVVRRWNDAHAAHDAKALEGLYAASVSFYGQRLSPAEIAQRKTEAFAKAPDYLQAVRALVSEMRASTACASHTSTLL